MSALVGREASTIAVIGVLCVLVAITSSCDEGSRSSDGHTTTVRNDVEAAHLFLEAVSRYRVRAAQLSAHGTAKAYAEERNCPRLVHPPTATGRFRTRMAVVVSSIEQLLASKATADAYRALASELTAIRTRNPDLLTVAREARRAATRAAELKGASIELCALLREWRETGWNRRFERDLLDGYALYGVDSGVVVRAKSRGAEMIYRLKKLGLNLRQALAIAAVPGAF